MDASGIRARLPSPLQELHDDRLGSVRVLLKRDDLIHPTVTGNKWRKLRHLLPAITASGATGVLTFGGGYSNHVRAVAAWGRSVGLPTIGVIRGEEQPFNELLAASVADGMSLHYLDRRTYRRKTDPDVESELRRLFGNVYIVPEGGTTTHAIAGCAEIVDEIMEPFDLILTAVGTGGTLAGLAAGLGPDQRALGISTLRGVASLEPTVDRLHRSALGHGLGNWSIDHRFHHGGFARRSTELDHFLRTFEDRHGIALDHVYVGKMLFALFALVADAEIAPSSVVVALVTGSPVPSGTRSRRHAPDLMV